MDIFSIQQCYSASQAQKFYDEDLAWWQKVFFNTLK